MANMAIYQQTMVDLTSILALPKVLTFFVPNLMGQERGCLLQNFLKVVNFRKVDNS
jgi:hypothetical protein